MMSLVLKASFHMEQGLLGCFKSLNQLSRPRRDPETQKHPFSKFECRIVSFRSDLCLLFLVYLVEYVFMFLRGSTVFCFL